MIREIKSLMAGLAILSPPTLVAEEVHTLRFNESDFARYEITAPNGYKFTKVTGADMFGSGESGSPEVPFKTIRFLVPDNAKDFTVSLETLGESRILHLEKPLYPVQAEISINDYTDDCFVYPDTEIYTSSSMPIRAEILDDSWLEGCYHIVSVGVWPIAYNGSPRELEYCQEINIRLDYTEDAGYQKSQMVKHGRGFADISKIVVNSACYPEKTGSKGLQTSEGSGSGLGRYYIISERALLAALEDLATWKRQKGYHVVLKAIEDVYADSRYKVGTNGIVDEAASLRRYLQDEFSEHGTFFCFLVGDHRTRMPIRKQFSTDSSVSALNANDEAYVPTDNYFSDLVRSESNLYYDQQGIHTSKLDNVYNPSIYVGRLLCHTTEQIGDYVKKLVLYETNPGRGHSEYLNKSLMTVQFDGRYRYKETLDLIGTIFPQVDCMKDTIISNSNASHYPTGEMTLQAINKSGYCSLMGHGEPTTIACSGRKGYGNEWEYIKAKESYINYDKAHPELLHHTNITNKCSRSGVDLMTNSDSPSVIYTISCTTAPFDVYTPQSLTFDFAHTMASSYTCGGQYGGVAYLGNTRNGYFGPSNELEKKFLNVIRKFPKVGMAEVLSKQNWTGMAYVLATHNLIGDPDVELWCTTPFRLQVELKRDGEFLTIHGNNAKGGYIVIDNGENDFSCHTIEEQDNQIIKYGQPGELKSVGLFKTGYLPIVSIDAFDDYLTNCDKQFYVRNAKLGQPIGSLLHLGDNSDVRISAVDEISTGPSLIICEGGTLTMNCDKSVIMEGSKVESQGRMIVQGETVRISNGFSLTLGGKLSINTQRR